MRVFFSAGEASGDAYAAALIQELGAGFDLESVGGAHLRSTGAKVIADSSKWGALGLMETLKIAPHVVGGFNAAKVNLRQGAPGIFVPIDYGYINVRLARRAKELGWQVLYFIPPGSWRRDKQGKDLPAITTKIVTPFPWSAEILNGMGADAHFFGHPVLQMIERGGVEPTRDPEEIAVLPGSRHHEIINNLPAIAAAVRSLNVKRLAFAVASTIEPSELKALWESNGGAGLEARFDRDRYQVMRAAHAGIVCSGTATLEAAMCGLPHVVVYRGSKAMEYEYRIRRPKFEYISLPNLILQQPILAELIQWDASPERIAHELEKVWRPGEERQRQLDAFAHLRSDLGPTDCLAKTAELIRSMAGK